MPENEIHYLFGYRDLVAETLTEHRAVLESQNFCWWGWWKRPNEPAHREIWHDLKTQTNRKSSIYVGLFHSGTGEVHHAKIDDVIEPTEDEYGNLLPVSPPVKELIAVPAYYRDSSYSRGWLRITSISPTGATFFSNYSFTKPPELSAYSSNQLRRFRDKKILDADELRTMDTTIWSVRPSRRTDRTERVITLGTTSLDEPLSPRPVSCPGEWMLHITDPHYAVGPFRGQHAWRLESESDTADSTMVDAIHKALIERKRTVGAVLLTGDLTYIASPAEFNEASTSLFKLVNGMLELGLEHLITIPGNHDIAWTNATDYSDDRPVNLAPAEATAAFRAFSERLYGYAPNEHLSMARRLVFPTGNVMDVIALNSSSLEQGKNFLAGMGRVQEAAYKEAATSLNWHEGSGLALRILALHHHVALTEDLESASEFHRGFGIAVDAAKILRLAAESGVHIAIHGHKHRSFLWRTGVYHLPELTQERWDLGNINIVGGGTSGSPASESQHKFFNLIRISEGLVELEMYRSRNLGAFQRFASWTAKLTPGEQGTLQISAWQKVT